MADTVCFWEAFRRQQQGPESERDTREEKLMWYLAQHAKGVRHPPDLRHDTLVDRFDAIGLAFRNVSLKDDYTPLNGM